MTFKKLQEPIVESGIRNTNFFEGRLLSGKDLSEQEHANRLRRQQLGKALGHGVVDGLEVSVESIGSGNTKPVVRVAGGLAITLDGDTIELSQEYVDLQLSRELGLPSVQDTVFKNCTNLPTESLLPSSAGLYILVMYPASSYKEYAPKSGLQEKGIAHNCGRAYVVEGVQFRLVKFDPTKMPNIDPEIQDYLEQELLDAANPVRLEDLESLSMMRNLVAHICFGTQGVINAATDPNFFIKGTTARGLDALIGQDEGFSSCDTPLCLIYWNLDGIAFVDNWAVKRKASYRDIAPYSIPSFTRHSYNRADESRLQFQEQLRFLQDKVTNLGDFSVRDYFRYLPPVGYLPISFDGAGAGFDVDNFFSNVTVRKTVFVEAAALTPITQVALVYWPIDLESEEMLWLYRTRENAQAADASSTSTLQEYIVFTSGHAPYAGNARFNLNKWDYSNYGFI